MTPSLSVGLGRHQHDAAWDTASQPPPPSAAVCATGLNYIQSVTPNLSVGGEFFYLSQVGVAAHLCPFAPHPCLSSLTSAPSLPHACLSSLSPAPTSLPLPLLTTAPPAVPCVRSNSSRAWAWRCGMLASRGTWG